MADDKMKENKDAQSGEPVQLDKDKMPQGEQHEGGQQQNRPQQPAQQRPDQHEGGQKR